MPSPGTFTTLPEAGILFGHAVNYARNRRPSLVQYLDDARFAIDIVAAERAIRHIAVGRANWHPIGGDGGLATASILLSLCASARRNRLDPWAYLSSVLADVSVRVPGADVADLLPDQ